MSQPEQSEVERTGRRVAEALLGLEGTGQAWGLRLEGAGAGWARVSMRVRADMLNGLGLAHGGMIFALADTAFAYACNSHNVRAVAQSATIAFLDPGRAGERLTAEARECGVAGRSGVATVQVTGEDGRTIAVFQGLSRTIGGPVLTEDAQAKE